MCGIAMGAAGMPVPTPPPGDFDPGQFAQCMIFGKLFESATVTGGIHAAANATAGSGSIAEGAAAAADWASKHPVLIGLGLACGADYCWRRAHIVGCPLGDDWAKHSPLTQGVP